MVAPGWLVATALSLIGVALLIVVRLSMANGMGTEYAVFGALFLALGVIVGMISAGVRNVYAIVIVFVGLFAILAGSFAFEWFGPGGLL
jgi:hypothetical protein